MRGRYCDDNRGLAEEDSPFAMPENNAAEFRPALPGLVGNDAKARLDLFGPRLVIDMGNSMRAVSMVPHQTAENHHRAATWERDPIGCEPDLKRLIGQRDPIVGGGWLKSHGCPS